MSDDAATTTETEMELPVEIEVDREHTRRLIVKLAFGQFNMFVFAALGAMVFKGWEVSPATSNYMTMVLQAEIALLTSVGAFYLMMSTGQKKTGPPQTTTTTTTTPPPPDGPTTVTTTQPPKP